MSSLDLLAHPEIAALLARGEDVGCLELSRVDAVVQALGLGDDEVEELEAEVARRGIELLDDCGRAGVPPTSYGNGDLAVATTDALDLFLRDVRRYPLLTAAEEVELAKRIEQGDLEAKERMINSNLRLVVSNARRYQGQDVALLDLIQEGVLGLMRAVEKFDWRRGYKFSTYGTYWIRQSMQRAVGNTSRTIRMPIHLGQRERRLARAQSALAARLGRSPTDAELAEEAGVSLAELHDLRSLARTVTSLDRPVGEEGEATFGDLLAGETLEPAEELQLDLSRAALHTAVAELPADERRVIELRYGLAEEPLTVFQTARRLGLPQATVRRLEQEALQRLALERELDAFREAA
jgi:RNA polymerase primary sigma factor